MELKPRKGVESITERTRKVIEIICKDATNGNAHFYIAIEYRGRHRKGITMKSIWSKKLLF
jgi:hypothetical protein